MPTPNQSDNGDKTEPVAEQPTQEAALESLRSALLAPNHDEIIPSLIALFNVTPTSMERLSFLKLATAIYKGPNANEHVLQAIAGMQAAIELDMKEQAQQAKAQSSQTAPHTHRATPIAPATGVTSSLSGIGYNNTK